MVLNFERDLRQFSEAETLKSSGAQNYLEAWCRANGDIRLTFLSREEWESVMVEKPLIETGENVVVTVPDDLKLWEVFGVVDLIDEVIDVEPEQANKEKSKLKNTINMFRQSALYLRQYVYLIDWAEDEQPAKELAQNLAKEFYGFSRSLLKKRQVTKTYGDIPQVDFVGVTVGSEEEVRVLEKSKYEVETWLIGIDFLRKHYDRLQKKLGRQPTINEVEIERQKMIKTFFKALSRECFDQVDFKNIEEDDAELADISWREYAVVFLGVPDEELSEGEKQEKSKLEANFLQTRAWKKIGPNLLLQLSTTLGIKQIFAKPVSEMEQAIFRRGKNQLIQSLKEAPEQEPEVKDNAVIKLLKQGFGLDVEAKRKLLTEKLQVERLKSELIELRNGSATQEQISEKELSIVDLIQEEVSQYEYDLTSSLPQEVAVREKINCVGAVLISGMLFEAVGIKYLVGAVEGHAINFVVTSDDEIHFRDMRIPEHNCKLGSDQFDVNNLTKLREFVKAGEPDVLHVDSDVDWYIRVSLGSQKFDPNLEIFQGEKGVYSMVMNNFSLFAGELAGYDIFDTEAVTECLESYLDSVPNDWTMTYNLIMRYIDAELTDAAALYLYRLEQMKPDSSNNMIAWTALFLKIDRFDLAIEACRNGLTKNSKNAFLWDLLLDIYSENDEVENYLSTCFQARFNLDFAGFTQKAIDLLVKEERYGDALKQDQLLIDQFPDNTDFWLQHLEHKARVFTNDETIYRQLCDWYWRAGNNEKVWEIVLLAGRHNAGELWMAELLLDYRALVGGESVGAEVDAQQADFDIPALV